MKTAMCSMVWMGVLALAAAPAAAGQAFDRGGTAAAKASGVRLAANQTRVDESGEVKFTIAASAGESTLVAEAPGVKFEKRVTADTVRIRVEAAGDMLELEADAKGSVRMARRGKARRFRMAVKPEDRIQQAQELTAGSTALMAFESLAGFLESSSRPEAQSVLTSYALVQAVRGSNAPARTLARRIRNKAAKGPVARASFVSDRGESSLGCWVEFEHTVMTYANELEECHSDWWWNPVMISACNIVWIIQAELAWFGVIACSGGLPI